MKKRRIAAFAAVFLMLLPQIGCGEGNEKEPVRVEGYRSEQLSLWTAHVLEKYRSDFDYGEQPEEPLEIRLAKGETEGAQIVFAAKEDIESYTVEVSPLKQGMAVIPAGNVRVYHEKYLCLDEKYYNNPAYPLNSMLPDAILPMETAQEYGENCVKAGYNQAVYIEVSTLTDQAPGLYTGTATLRADNRIYTVPVEVTVWDFEIPSTPSVQNYLSTFGRDHIGAAELDASDEMAEAYFEKLLTYRMNSELPFTGIGGIPRYIELLRKYDSWPGFSSFRFYYELSPSFYAGESIPFNAPLIKEYLKAVVKASMEDGRNYLDKAMFYFSNIIDEPGTEEAYENVRKVLKVYKQLLIDTDAELRDELRTYRNFLFYAETISPTLLNIPNVLPETNTAVKGILESEPYGVDNLTHCPVANLLDTPYWRDYYMGDGESIWWYTCGVPGYPYPTNHIEDNPITFRVLSWMQRAYGVEGYLNWAVCDHLQTNYGLPVEDPYEDLDRSWGVPGDGYMYYPGRPYGIYGPVATLRCVNYRDGMEEYEYLKLLEDVYREKNVDPTSILSSLYDQIFTGTLPSTSVDTFEQVREELAHLIEMTNSNFGVIYQEIEISGNEAKITFNTANEQAEVYSGGQRLDRSAGGLYELEVDLRETNILTLEVRFDGGSSVVEKRLCGRYEDLTAFDSPEDADLVRVAQTDSKQVENSALRLELNGFYDPADPNQTANYTPFFAISSEVIHGGKLSEVENFMLRIRCESVSPPEAKESVKLSVRYFDEERSMYVTIHEAEIRVGETLDLQIKNLYAQQNIGTADGLYFMFENFLLGEIPAKVTLLVDDIAYTVR